MKINKLALLEKACTTDTTRYVLLHPYIDATDPKKPVAVATNGRILAVVPMESAVESDTGRVSCEALLAARKLAKRDDCAEFTLIETRKHLLSTGAVLPALEAVNYPNWRQVIPAKDRPVKCEIAFDPSLLLALAQAIGSPGGVVLEIAGDCDAITVKGTPNSYTKAKGHTVIDGAHGVLMPIRTA